MRRIFLSFFVVGLIFGFVACGSDSNSKIKIKGTGGASTALAILATSGSPTYLLITVYAAYASTHEDCSDPVLIQDHGSAGTAIDMFASGGPTLFEGNPGPGTYPCLILKISDTMKFKVDSEAVTDHSACVSTDTEHTFDVYRDGNSDDGMNIDLNGAVVDARGSAASPVSDVMYIFASTGARENIKMNGTAISEYQFVPLANALQVPSELSFYFDMSDGVATHNEASVDYCWLEGTDSSGFGFR